MILELSAGGPIDLTGVIFGVISMFIGVVFLGVGSLICFIRFIMWVIR